MSKARRRGDELAQATGSASAAPDLGPRKLSPHSALCPSGCPLAKLKGTVKVIQLVHTIRARAAQPAMWPLWFRVPLREGKGGGLTQAQFPAGEKG